MDSAIQNLNQLREILNFSDASVQLDHNNAFENGKLDVLQNLVENFKQQQPLTQLQSINNISLFNPFIQALQNSHFDIAEYLFRTGELNLFRQINEKDGTPLCYFTKQGNLNAVKYLISKGCHPTDSNYEISTNNTTTPNSNTPSNSNKNALQISVSMGHVSILEYFLSIGSDPNFEISEGENLLQCACKNGKLNVSKLLISKGCNPKQVRKSDGITLLHLAARCDLETFENSQLEEFISLVQFLIQLGCDVNARTKTNSQTPLHFACLSPSVSIVHQLLSSGALLDAHDFEHCTPFWMACRQGRLETVKYLHSLDANINASNVSGLSALSVACRNGRTSVVKFLLSVGVDPNTRDSPLKMTALAYAASRTIRTEIVSLLLEAGANPNIPDEGSETPLFMATAKANFPIVRCLVESGKCDLNTGDWKRTTPFARACEGGLLEIAKFLLERGADPNIADLTKATPLLRACLGGHMEVVRFLVANGCDPKQLDDSRFSSVHLAARSGNLELVKYFHSLGCDLNSKTNYGNTPLWIACSFGSLEVVKWLVANGANVNESSDDFTTPLMAVAYGSGSVEVARFLIANGADLNIVDKIDNTVISLACQNCHIGLLRFLLSIGCDPNQQTPSGKTLLMAALREHTFSLEIVRTLVLAGATVDAKSWEFATARGLTEHAKYLKAIGQKITRMKKTLRLCRVVACSNTSQMIPINKFLLLKLITLETLDSNVFDCSDMCHLFGSWIDRTTISEFQNLPQTIHNYISLLPTSGEPHYKRSETNINIRKRKRTNSVSL